MALQMRELGIRIHLSQDILMIGLFSQFLQLRKEAFELLSQLSWHGMIRHLITDNCANA